MNEPVPNMYVITKKVYNCVNSDVTWTHMPRNAFIMGGINLGTLGGAALLSDRSP